MLIVNNGTYHRVTVHYVSATARTVFQQKHHAEFTCLPQMGQAANALPATVLPDCTDAGSLRFRFFVRAGFSMQNNTQRQYTMYVGRYSAV